MTTVSKRHPTLLTQAAVWNKPVTTWTAYRTLGVIVAGLVHRGSHV